MKTILALVASFTTLLAVGCAVETSEGTDGPGTTPPGSAASATSLPTYTAAEIVGTKATCGDTADSMATPYASIGQLEALLEGSWLFCPSSASDRLPYGAAGLQFTDEGELRWLVTDENGALTSAVSPLNSSVATLTPSTDVPDGGDTHGARISYEIEPFTSDAVNNVSGQINVFYADRSVMPTRATFEGSPRRMALQDLDGTFLYVGP